MTTEPTFDPTAPLAGPPDPWESSPAPSARSGPPFHMTDMIAAESALARRVLERVGTPGGGAAELAEAIRSTIAAGEPVVVTGCGTSEHAAQAIVEILGEAAHVAGFALATVAAEQAFELSLAPPARGLVIGVSHEGATGATNAALGAARGAGCRTALLTVSRRSAGAGLADIVIETAELDHGWCHTVGYLSPILAAAAVGAQLSGRALDADAVAGLLASGTRDEAGAEAIAARLADAAELLVVASGSDRPAGRELVLKVEEASWLPSAYRDLETFLHGHLPATGPETGLVVILTDRERRAERTARARQALAAARVIGLRAASIISADLDADLDRDLTPAGRLLVAEARELPAPVAALIGTATPLQLLTERLARARGTNPDLIRRDDLRYLAASEAANG
jgi:fructoselysine-6-P-deglycase FrlB-like protein